MGELSSGERMRITCKSGKADYVPLYFRVFDFSPPLNLQWNNQLDRAETWLSMGLDDILYVESPLIIGGFGGLGNPAAYHPDVRVKSALVNDPAEKYPVIVQEYDTPGGTLRQEVYKTPDWDSVKIDGWDHGGDRLQMYDDYNVSRSKKFLIANEQDLNKLKYLFHQPSDLRLNDFKEYALEVKKNASRLGVITAAWTSTGTDSLIHLCGVENSIFLCKDRPELFRHLLSMIHKNDIEATEICLDIGVDMIVRRGWYEGCDFWSPGIFNEYFLPNIKDIVKLAHENGSMAGYILASQIMPILPSLLEAGYDVHWFVDDLQGGADFKKVKGLFSGKTAILGGINSAVTMETEPAEMIKKRVRDAVEILGRGGGFVLSPVDALYSSTPWESVKTVIDTWKEVRNHT